MFRFTRQSAVVGADVLAATLQAYEAGLVIPKVYRKSVTDADLTDADTSQKIAFSDFPTNVVRGPCIGNLKEVFAGGTVSAITAKVGDTGDDDEVFSPLTVFTGAGLGKKMTKNDPLDTKQWKCETDWAGDGAGATFDSTGDNLVNLTTGDIEFHVLYLDPVIA